MEAERQGDVKVLEEEVEEIPILPVLSGMEDIGLTVSAVTAVATEVVAVVAVQSVAMVAAVVEASAGVVPEEMTMVPVLMLQLQTEAAVQPDITEELVLAAQTVGLAEAEVLIMDPAAVVTVEVEPGQETWVAEEVDESVWRLCRRGGRLVTLRYGCLMKAPAKSAAINAPEPVGLKYP